MSIIIFLAILAILILVHEFGHFIVAKKSGIRVDEFGLGFPPKIFAKKFGGTLYTLNAIPFGGFVKIFGEDSHGEVLSEQDKKVSFVHKPKYVQALVLVAGVAFNVIFAWLLLSTSFVIGMPSPVNYTGLGTVKDVHVVVTDVLVNSPAKNAGIKTGDQIVSISSGKEKISNEKITPDSIQDIISKSNSSIDITVSRGKKVETFSVSPSTNIVEGKKAIGISMDEMGTLKLPIHLALIEGARTTYLVTKNTAVGLLSFISGIFLLKSDLSQVSGPIGIAGVVGEATKLGLTFIISLTALISINLAIINLLPFPALDGGRLLFVFIEAIRRKPISPRFVRTVNFVGFALLLVLMVVVSLHDIFKLF